MKYLRLIRVKHYLKNFLIFLPLIFSQNLLNKNYFFTTLLGFLCFSIACSIIYIFNDIKDVEKDRLHPEKKHRPLASGEIKIKTAIILEIILIIANILILYFSALLFSFSTIILVAYVFINILYSIKLKNIPLIDITILSLGFILRVFYGGLIINTKISNWLFLTILCGSYYLAFGKRRNELAQNKSTSRNVLKYYSKDFLNTSMNNFMVLSVVFYSLWATNINEFPLLKYSIFIVIYLILKYSIIVDGKSNGDPIEVIFKNKSLIVLGAIYMLYVLSVIYIF